MLKNAVILVLCALVITTAGCGILDNFRQDKRDHAAIQAALDKYIAAHVDLSAVTVEVEEFNTDRDSAELIVEFTAKQGGAESKRKYSLAREAGVWTVKSDQLFIGGVLLVPPSTPAPASKKP